MSGKPNTRLQPNLHKELQSRSKIPVKTPESYISKSVTNTPGYIGVLVPGGSSTSGDKNKYSGLNSDNTSKNIDNSENTGENIENSGNTGENIENSENTGENMVKSVNTGEKIHKSGKIMHTKANTDNIRAVRGDNISVIRDFDPMFQRKATFAQQENYFHNSADMQFRNATQDFELKEKISADRSAEIKEKDQIIAELRKQLSTKKLAEDSTEIKYKNNENMPNNSYVRHNSDYVYNNFSETPYRPDFHTYSRKLNDNAREENSYQQRRLLEN